MILPGGYGRANRVRRRRRGKGAEGGDNVEMKIDGQSRNRRRPAKDCEVKEGGRRTMGSIIQGKGDPN